MESSIFDLAYEKASRYCKEAVRAVARDIRAENPAAVLYRASARAIELHFNAIKLAEKVWAKSIAYEKAEEILAGQFPEFAWDVCRRALSAAYVETR